MGELKPCPFCGQTDVAETGAEDFAQCFCQAMNGRAAYAEYWNRRPLEEVLEARVKELINESIEVIHDQSAKIDILQSDLIQAKAAAVQWVTYTGEPETLPDQIRYVMVTLAGHAEPVAALCLLYISSDHAMYWASTDKDWAVGRGDRWAYLPMPPASED